MPIAVALFLAATSIAPAQADSAITVAFAGSMGVVMDRGLAPAFTAKTGIIVHPMGQAAMALAHLITAKSINPDVFISVSAAPIKVVEAASLSSGATPIAGTSMVLAYGPKSPFAASFAAAHGADWTKILEHPGLRFGRTDPKTDPQGQYVLYTLQLAGKFYHIPGFAHHIAGGTNNPAQIFTEPSLLSRLQDGEIDASLGYESAVRSQHLPFIVLPPEINLGSPAMAASWYKQASLTTTTGGTTKITHPSPLVFYATALKNAPNPAAARAFVAFLNSKAGQKIFAQYGYAPGQGPGV
ncbi:MAG: extracellular solute-binding protein [Acidocella sp.]|nr:extracellular solute-binding protein [Acidocella sp.]